MHGRWRHAGPVPAALLSVMMVACGGGAPGASAPASVATVVVDASLPDRLASINAAVDRWRGATDLAEARRGAEEARNLVVGPAGPDYGDADGDGIVEGASDIGLLPGLAGQPGLARPGTGTCIERDILGGSWAEPGRRWDILEHAISAWSETNNPFPTLPSHPQRIVGWATLALATADLTAAREFGGHAHLHVDVSTQAATVCAE